MAQCAKPTLTPPGGTASTVTIATATRGAYLCYTLDGSTPTDGPSPHGKVIAAQSGPVTNVFGRTLKAIAYKTGWADSPIAVGNYTASH